MQVTRWLLAAALICGSCTSVLAIKGPSTAGPIGGTDMRTALFPPPGVYGGDAVLRVEAIDFVDGQGQLIPELREAHLARVIGGPFVVYIPDVDVFGGHIGFGAFFSYGQQCGHLIPTAPRPCQAGFGDPYFEAAWSRFFGKVRASRDPSAYPIAEGLAIRLGFGVVVPVGQYNAADVTTQALSTGTNIWDFAPNVAFTYTTPPIIADGTEVSAKLYWNNYLINPATQYSTGSLLNLDFAITEKIGRFQVGVAASMHSRWRTTSYSACRSHILSIGAVLAYDISEHAMSVKI
jgi:hypothetical protein